MDHQSIAPYFLLMLLYFGVAMLFLRGDGFYARMLSPGVQGRYESLDGLRGFLAMGVFFHHAVIMHAWYVSGVWSAPKGFYGYLGPDSVRFFFMITGFLFWTKAIHNGARIDALKLWRNRLLRIAPMCLFSILVMSLLAAVQSRFQLLVPVGRLIEGALACLTLGAVTPTINGIVLDVYNASVFWTLRYEWSFYLAIPLLAWFATPKRLAWFCLASIPIGVIAAPYSSSVINLDTGILLRFLMGMVTAQLVASRSLERYFHSALWPLVAIALLAPVRPYSWMPSRHTLLMFVVFTAIAYDSRLFAFLRWRPAKFLGTISYSIYLMHAIVLFVVFRVVNRLAPVAEITPRAFWSITCFSGLMTLLCSAATYRFVEHPFLSTKRSVSRAAEDALPARRAITGAERTPVVGAGTP